MQAEYYYEFTLINKFDDLCTDLLSRKRLYDQKSFSILVVDQIFKTSINLCELSSKAVDLHKFEQLVGVKSDTFQNICKDDRLFHHFLFSLGTHCKKSRTPFEVIRGSVYLWYFISVLTYLLPNNDTSLVALKKLDWFCAINKHSATKSALRLLKPQVIATSYSPNLFARTDGFQSLYPRSFDYVKHLFECLSDRSAAPTEGQVLALKNMTTYYATFLLASTGDADFNAFKSTLRSQDLLSRQVKPFLTRWFQNMALDQMYIELVEFWLFLISPDESLKSREQLTAFFNLVSKQFGDLFLVLMDRCLIADLNLSSHVKFIKFVVSEVFTPSMSFWYEKLGYSPDEYLIQIQSKISQYKQQLEIDFTEKQKNSSQNKVAAFLGFVQSIVTPSPLIQELQKILDAISEKLANSIFAGAASSSSGSALHLSHISGEGSTLSTSFHPLANSTPVRKTPDSRYDPKTKFICLTSEGREQVLRRQAAFDFSQSAANLSRISPDAGPYEIQWLVTWMCHLSKKYSDSKFTRYLRINNGRSVMATLLSKIFLANPYANRHVPMYTRNAAKKLPELNLRFMASYPFILSAFVALWIISSFVLGIFF